MTQQPVVVFSDNGCIVARRHRYPVVNIHTTQTVLYLQHTQTHTPVRQPAAISAYRTWLIQQYVWANANPYYICCWSFFLLRILYQSLLASCIWSNVVYV